MALKDFLFTALFGLANLLTVAVFWKQVWITVILLLFITLFGQIRWRRQETFLIFIAAAVLGGFAEVVGVGAGAWHYTTYTVFAVPAWLFVLWGNAASFIYQTTIEVFKDVEK